MDKSALQELSRNWLTFALLPEAEQEKSPLARAFNDLLEMVQAKPEEAWEVILEIYKLCKTDLQLAVLAAGPLEILLGTHGEQFIERCDSLARQDESFLYLLTGVWGKHRMSNDLWSRFCAITERSKRRL